MPFGVGNGEALYILDQPQRVEDHVANVAQRHRFADAEQVWQSSHHLFRCLNTISAKRDCRVAKKMPTGFENTGEITKAKTIVFLDHGMGTLPVDNMVGECKSDLAEAAKGFGDQSIGEARGDAAAAWN